MPNNRNNNSWNSDDLMPPVSNANPVDTTAHSVPDPSVDRLRRPSTPSAVTRSALDQNQALIDISVKLRRGQTAEARADILALLESGAGSAAAYEALGDVEAACGNLSASVDAYKRALAVEPGRPSTETKLARTALRVIDEQRRSTVSATYAARNPYTQTAAAPPRKNVVVAVIASLIFPGLGQLVKGEYLKGGIIAAVTIVVASLIVEPTINAVWPHLKADFASLNNPAGPLPTQPQLPVVSWLGLILLTAAFIYSVVDAALPPRRAGDRPSTSPNGPTPDIK